MCYWENLRFVAGFLPPRPSLTSHDFPIKKLVEALIVSCLTSLPLSD
jgi:hypothetical protein